jgi:hypothetical protein
MDSVGKRGVVHAEEVTAISTAREFYCLRKSPDLGNKLGNTSPVGWSFRDVFFYLGSHPSSGGTGDERRYCARKLT